MSPETRRAPRALRALALFAVAAQFHALPPARASAQEATAATRRQAGNGGGASQPFSSDGGMQGADLGRTRVFRTRAPRAPKSLEQHSQKLFELKNEFPNDSESLFGRSSGFWHSSDGDHFTAPVVAGDAVYFTASAGHGYVFALDKRTGERKWRLRGEGERFSALAVAGGAVYLATEGGTFFALDAATGRLLWESKDKERAGLVAPPAVYDGLVYFSVSHAAGEKGSTHALDARTGAAVWRFDEKKGLTSPVIADGTLYTGGDRVIALDAKTGREKWRLKDGSGAFTMAAGGGTIYFSHFGGELRAVAAEDGALRWKADKKFKTRTVLAVGHDTIYFGGKGRNFHAIDAATGRERWLFKTGQHCGAPSLAEDLVVFSCGGESLHALDARTGEERWKFGQPRATTSTPAISDAVVYLLRSDGFLYATR